jgi:hypothetical protein
MAVKGRMCPMNIAPSMPSSVQHMDAIWEILHDPQAVNWSATNPPNKTFDRRVSLSSTGYGRVVLMPTTSPEDIAVKRVTQFDFVSWHPISQEKFAGAQRDAARDRVTPTDTPPASPPLSLPPIWY